jgi:hypothetical protein
MMGRHEGQKALFSYQVDLDRRVHADHPLRRVHAMVDFSFVRSGNAERVRLRILMSDIEIFIISISAA